MNGRIILGILLVLVLIGGAVGLANYAYNAGVAQGLSDSGRLTAPGGAVPYPYFGYGGPFFRPFGFGFGIFGFIFPLLFFVLIFLALRGLFWRGRGWHGPRGDWGQGAPPMFEEWHRRVHETPSQPVENK